MQNSSRDPGPLITRHSSPSGMLTPSPSSSPPEVGLIASKLVNNNNPSVANNNTRPELLEAGADVLASSVPTWHPHVYARPPRSPTPHRIVDILGWKERAPPTPPSPGAPVAPVAARAASVLIVPRVPVLPGAMDLDEPLNLSLRSRETPLSPVLPQRSFNGLPHLDMVTVPAVRVPVPVAALRDSSISTKKRKKETCNVASAPDSNPSADSHSDGGGPEGDRKRKKARTTFTGRQIFELEKQFELKKYLSSSERADMARLLNVTDTQVKIWFQNRRTKWKKHDNISNSEAAEHKSQQQAPVAVSSPPLPTQAGAPKRPTVVVKKSVTVATSSVPTASAPSALSGAPSGSPFSADEHSDGSLFTGDGSVSESGFSEESRALGSNSGPSILTPPPAMSPCTASLSPVFMARSPHVAPLPHTSPQRDVCTASPSAAVTPSLGATFTAVATPVARNLTIHSSPSPEMEGEESSAVTPIAPAPTSPLPS